MSRVAKSPITIPEKVTVSFENSGINVKRGSVELYQAIHNDVSVEIDNGIISVSTKVPTKQAVALAGTTRSLLNNMIEGVSKGFEKKLTLVGVGYRAQVKGKQLSLTLGFSHPVNYDIPDGITIETPSQTEIIVKGANKQKVGQVSAEIRAYRPPEPYKGKGVRYSDEHVVRKEAKKK